jgi:hypothetical protein
MAKIISPGYTDTSIPENPVLTRGKLNYNKDFRPAKDGNGSLTLVNITSPMDRPEEILMNFSQIKNIYDKTSIDPSVYAPSTKGVNLYLKLQDTYQVTDDTDPSFVQHLPITASITLRVPQSEFITATNVQTVLARAVSGLYDTGSVAVDRLNAALRGSLKPSDL